jgi:ABC-type multidrug transport system permease subunit
MILVKRDVLNTVRNPMLFKSCLFANIFLAIFTSGVYYQFTGEHTSRLNWRALTGCLFFLSFSTMLTALNPVQLVFPSERGVFLKEEGAKLYSTFSYFLSRTIVEFPTSIIFPLIVSLIMYWFVGLSSTVEQFFIFYLISYLLTLNGASLGLMLGALILDKKSAAVVTPVVLLPFFLFSGFFKNTGNLPVWIGWIQYISPIKYGLAGYIQNEVQFAS